jgi:hypothetical protein
MGKGAMPSVYVHAILVLPFTPLTGLVGGFSLGLLISSVYYTVVIRREQQAGKKSPGLYCVGREKHGHFSGS